MSTGSSRFLATKPRFSAESWVVPWYECVLKFLDRIGDIAQASTFVIGTG